VHTNTKRSFSFCFHICDVFSFMLIVISVSILLFHLMLYFLTEFDEMLNSFDLCTVCRNSLKKTSRVFSLKTATNLPIIFWCDFSILSLFHSFSHSHFSISFLESFERLSTRYNTTHKNERQHPQTPLFEMVRSLGKCCIAFVCSVNSSF
jgi:hypothetical protein